MLPSRKPYRPISAEQVRLSWHSTAQMLTALVTWHSTAHTPTVNMAQLTHSTHPYCTHMAHRTHPYCTHAHRYMYTSTHCTQQPCSIELPVPRKPHHILSPVSRIVDIGSRISIILRLLASNDDSVPCVICRPCSFCVCVHAPRPTRVRTTRIQSRKEEEHSRRVLRLQQVSVHHTQTNPK